ncbi:hypothetical protein KY284_016071 [Solanum tuberosum]|nr:hypothetical protein KY284_016071 [Solanum tuberosum]
MHDRVRRFVRGLDSDYIDACSTAALNENMDISRILAFAQGIEDRRHLQYMSERVERDRRGICPLVHGEIFKVVPDPDILVGHLDLHHDSSKVVDLIVRDSQAQVRVHEHHTLSNRGVQASLGQHRRVTLPEVGCILGGIDRVPQVVILVDSRGMGGGTARP